MEMIEVLSNRLAIKLKEINPEETASVEVMSYALQGILHNVVTVLAAVVVGSVFDQFWDTLLAAICIAMLRWVSGGFHFKSALACFLLSAAAFILIPMIHVSEPVLIILNVIALILVAIYAPSVAKEHIRVPEKFLHIYKVISIVIVMINFLYLAPIVTIAFFAQACTLLPFKEEVRS